MRISFKKALAGVAVAATVATAAPLLGSSVASAATNNTTLGALNLSPATGNSATNITLQPQLNTTGVRSLAGAQLTAGSATVTVTGGDFTSADQFRPVSFSSPTGTAVGPAGAIILSVTNSTTVVLSAAATGTSTGEATINLQARAAACPGDTAGSPSYNWATFLVPAATDIDAQLRFDAGGPVLAAGPGSGYTTSLLDGSGNTLVSQATNIAGGPGQPGLFSVPQVNFSLFAPGEVPAGVYKIGVACYTGPASSSQLQTYWVRPFTVTTNASTGGPAQFSYTLGATAAAPTLTAATAGNAQVVAAFTAGSSDPAASSFTATATPASGPAITASGSTSPITITGLTNGTEYAVTVTATNTVGTSAASNAISATPTLPASPAVTGLTALPGAAGAIDLAWTAPAASAATLAGYEVVVTDGTTPISGSPFSVAVGTTTLTVPGLDASEEYQWTVEALYDAPDFSNPVAGPNFAVNPDMLVYQDITVTRPAGALVMTQVCGSYGALAADPWTPGLGTELSAVSGGSAPALGDTAPGTGTDPVFSGYPYPVNPDGTPNATYPTRCGIDMGNAQLVRSGDNAGKFFAAEGRLNQVSVVDTRDADDGWSVNGQVSDFVSGSNSFSGSQLGWTPVSSDSAGYADSLGRNYDQLVAAGSSIDANTPVASGLSENQSLMSAAALVNTSGSNFTGGLGIARVDARLKLFIPVTAAAGTYTATLTITAI